MAGDVRLGRGALQAILEPEHRRLLSVASLWEIAIKVSIGKLKSHGAFELLVASQVSGNALELLPIRAAHLDVVQGLPLMHRDPFDRLLVAQALVEDAVLLTRDEHLDGYGVRVLW